MHIATRLNVTPMSACPYHLALKYHEFLKQEIRNLLDAVIICKNIYPWVSPIVVVKEHTTDGSPQQYHLCIDYIKLKSLLPMISPATGTKKGTLAFMPL